MHQAKMASWLHRRGLDSAKDNTVVGEEIFKGTAIHETESTVQIVPNIEKT